MIEMAEKKTEVVIKTNDGKEHVTTVENYNAQEIADQLNDPQKTMMAIGDVIVHRSYLTGVKPVQK
jgi:hypothetical protein